MTPERGPQTRVQISRAGTCQVLGSGQHLQRIGWNHKRCGNEAANEDQHQAGASAAPGGQCPHGLQSARPILQQETVIAQGATDF